ncbi:MAG: hypothetical protein QW341_02930 [Candidatus Bathyarchaeia archaeon]
MKRVDLTEMKRFKAFIDLSKFEEHFLSDHLGLYTQLVKSLIEFIGTETEQNISSFAEAWRLSLKDVFMNLPAGLKKLFLETVKGTVYSLYAERLQKLPPYIKAEYEEKLSRTGPEEIALIFECPDCHNISISVKSIFDFPEKCEVECERCEHKVLVKPHIDENFLKWAWETYIPKQLMSALIKIIGRMSVVVCNVLAYENKVLCGATSTIDVAIEPPHPGCAFELTLIDPEGSKQIYKFSTNNNSICRWNYTFDKCGIWRIYASWPGDEDHIGSLSREVRVLVCE